MLVQQHCTETDHEQVDLARDAFIALSAEERKRERWTGQFDDLMVRTVHVAANVLLMLISNAYGLLKASSQTHIDKSNTGTDLWKK